MSASEIAARYARRLTWEDLDPDAIRQLIGIAQAEDQQGWGLARPERTAPDAGDWIAARRGLPKSGSATIVGRTNGVVAGLPLIDQVLEAYDRNCHVTLLTRDGETCAAGQGWARLHGPTAALLRAERVLLNFLQRLSGIATLTRAYVKELGSSPTRLLDTRKTTPGMRGLEKYAVAMGGGFNHRMGLFDRVMFKDNHLAAAKAQAGSALRDLILEFRKDWPDAPLQLEVDTVDQIEPALAAGIDCLLLDNFSTADLTKAVALTEGRCATEASGNITLERLPQLAGLGLDFISTGATIHQATWKDLSLEWDG
jgi:nicotinate-nucleotide pyrophosphorylase (carboxylating)